MRLPIFALALVLPQVVSAGAAKTAAAKVPEAKAARRRLACTLVTLQLGTSDCTPEESCALSMEHAQAVAGAAEVTRTSDRRMARNEAEK